MHTLTSLIEEVIERLDTKMALPCCPPIIRQTDEAAQPRSTELIHSQGTRLTYQEHVVHFVTWCHDQSALTRLAQLDARAEELASRYLEERLDTAGRTLRVAPVLHAARPGGERRACPSVGAKPSRARVGLPGGIAPFSPPTGSEKSTFWPVVACDAARPWHCEWATSALSRMGT
jgi:hypothetical protein